MPVHRGGFRGAFSALFSRLPGRPRLGGQLALAPWGPRPGDVPGDAQRQAAGAAEEDAAAEELQGLSSCLEGGLFVGADLSCAQVGMAGHMVVGSLWMWTGRRAGTLRV